MSSKKVPLPSKETLRQRLEELIPAEEIDRESTFYLRGLMWFTAEEMRDADEESLYTFLVMTMGANLSADTLSRGRPIDIDAIIDAIVGNENETVAMAVKERFRRPKKA